MDDWEEEGELKNPLRGETTKVPTRFSEGADETTEVN